MSIDYTRQSTDNSFNVTLVNQLLRLDDVTVTLQWLQEPGAVYRFNVLPDTSHTELTRIMSLDSITVNLTLFYNIQYNVFIVSSLAVSPQARYYIMVSAKDRRLLTQPRY